MLSLEVSYRAVNDQSLRQPSPTLGGTDSTPYIHTAAYLPALLNTSLTRQDLAMSSHVATKG
jgi:hypothetical protein